MPDSGHPAAPEGEGTTRQPLPELKEELRQADVPVLEELTANDDIPTLEELTANDDIPVLEETVDTIESQDQWIRPTTRQA